MFEQGKKNRLLLIGALGCTTLLCVAILISGGLLFATGKLNLLTDITFPTISDRATPTQTQAPIISTPTSTPSITATVAITQPDIQATTENIGTPQKKVEPDFGNITFARDITKDYEAISPAFLFEEGITKTHAIFDYSGMSADSRWERVWYLDGKEILRKSAVWTSEQSGRFDYFIDAGGSPLFVGMWTLELYVENKLLAKGSFRIKKKAPKITPRPTTTKTATPRRTTPRPARPIPTRKRQAVSKIYKLLYTKWDGGKHNLYIVDTNGKNELFLLNRAAGPSWMPDGRNIFFYGEQAIDRQLIDGVEHIFDVSDGIISMSAVPLPTNITEVRLYQRMDWKQGRARWTNISPNGQMVAFDSDHSGSYRIYFLGTANNQAYRYEIIGEQADWSPDSQKIAYRSGRNGQTGIWISNRDDSGHTLITNNGTDSFPAWSPDGKTIAFSREDGGNVDIYIMNIDGSNIRRLTNTPGPDTLPIYTPSGEIIFRTVRTGRWSIWKMDGTGKNPQEIIASAEVGPDWAFSKMDVR